ncbi:MAG: hypothetical protein ACRDE7_00040 [Sphingobacterium sp.]
MEGELLDILVEGYRVRIIKCLVEQFVKWHEQTYGYNTGDWEIEYLLEKQEITIHSMNLFVNDLITKKGPTEAGPN